MPLQTITIIFPLSQNNIYCTVYHQHTAGTFAKICSSSLLHSALFCAAAITSGGSCLTAVVANLELKHQEKYKLQIIK